MDPEFFMIVINGMAIDAYRVDVSSISTLVVLHHALRRPVLHDIITVWYMADVRLPDRNTASVNCGCRDSVK